MPEAPLPSFPPFPSPHSSHESSTKDHAQKYPTARLLSPRSATIQAPTVVFPAAPVFVVVACVVPLPVAVALPFTTATLVMVLAPPGTGVFVSTRMSLARLEVGLAVMVVLAKLCVQVLVDGVTGREVEVESVKFDIVLELVLELVLVVKFRFDAVVEFDRIAVRGVSVIGEVVVGVGLVEIDDAESAMVSENGGN